MEVDGFVPGTHNVNFSTNKSQVQKQPAVVCTSCSDPRPMRSRRWKRLPRLESFSFLPRFWVWILGVEGWSLRVRN